MIVRDAVPGEDRQAVGTAPILLGPRRLAEEDEPFLAGYRHLPMASSSGPRSVEMRRSAKSA